MDAITTETAITAVAVAVGFGICFSGTLATVLAIAAVPAVTRNAFVGIAVAISA